ncbi:hypothetical protein D7I39_10420 [Allopusillimonas ginsengisoli]|nr:hypothetical protein D7I39_10420 [Allopusillimonas ginsengisoli]
MSVALFRVILGTLACTGLAGCGLATRMSEISDVFAEARHALQQRHEKFSHVAGNAEGSHAARLAAQEVDRPWLAGKAQPLAREIALPSILRTDVPASLVFSGGALDLPAIARRITAATNIPVHIRPEALLPADAFLPRLASNGAASVTALTGVELEAGPQPLARLLDGVGARLGVLWRYQNNRIEFYRTETRAYSVAALALSASTQASLGLASGDSGKGFVSTSHTRLDSGEHDVFAVLKARIEPFLTRSGVVVAQPGASASIVVTDTPQVLDAVASYLDRENRTMLRRVRLVFEELTVDAHDTAEVAFDWGLVFASAQAAASLVTSGPVTAAASTLGAQASAGPFSGSEAVIKALSQAGRVVRHSSMPVITLNRRPVTHAVRTTFSYIDSVQTAALAGAQGMALPSVSVSQREQTVGSLLTLVPDVQDDGQILLSLAYDNTVAQPLRSVTFGSKNSDPLQLQQIAIDGNGTVQQVSLQPGQPLVISGFNRLRHESSGRRLNPDVPLIAGGSDKAATQQLTTVIIITAQIEE